MNRSRHYEHPEGLKIRTVVTGDQVDLIVAVQAADLREEVVHITGFSQANAVGQFGHGSVLDGIHADKFGGVGVFDEQLVEESIEWHAIGNLHAQDLTCHIAREQVETHHDQDHQADDHRSKDRQQVEFGTDRHADRHGG